jgi:hypothetical protein
MEQWNDGILGSLVFHLVEKLYGFFRQAAAVAAPCSVAMGESGCMCGALSGAILAIRFFRS